MRGISQKTIALTFLGLLIAATGFAQGPGGGAFSQFREDHKYTFQLTQMVRHIGDINKDPKHTLAPAQAKQVLAVLKPLRSKPKLTQDEAKQALKGLKKSLTVDQLNAMARIKPRPQSGQRGGGMGGPGARPGGPSANGGARPTRVRMDPSAMKNFNPFNVKSVSPGGRAGQMSKRWDSFFKDLELKSKQSKAAPAKRPASKPKR